MRSSKKLFFLFLSVLLVCCGEMDEDPNPVEPEPETDLAELRQNLAIHIADHFIIPAYVELNIDAEAMEAAMLGFENDPGQPGLVELRASLKVMWLSWQDAAIYQFGPSETNALRAALNTYPADSERIEQNIAQNDWTLGTISNRDAEGFPAIDYLINRTGISEEELISSFLEHTSRLEYLKDLVEEVRRRVSNTVGEWQTGNFLQDFTSASSRGTDVGSAIGILVNAMDLHFQRFLRDGKVAIPAGIRSAGVPRPVATESRFGGYSGELLIRSLMAYLDLFAGTGIDGSSGPSIFEYLKAINQQGLTGEIEAKFQEAILFAGGLDNSFAVQIESDNEKLIDMFMVLQEMVTLMKSDMASVMGISFTNQDNDGD